MKYIDMKAGAGTLRLSQIGLGTGRFGTKVSKELSFELLDIFVSRGGTVIDTARSYSEWAPDGRGISERTIGEWLEKSGHSGDVVISTKAGMNRVNGVQAVDNSREAVLREAGESLEALRRGWADIFLLHRDEPGRPAEEMLETLNELHRAGKARVIGVSNWSAGRVAAANAHADRNGLERLKIVQTWWCAAEYTESMWNDPTTTHMDLETYSYMLENGMTGMAYTSQARGFFSKAAESGLDAVDDFTKSRIVTPANLRKLEYIKDYSARRGVAPNAAVLGYITCNRLPGVALVGCSSAEQLNSALDAADYELEREAIAELDAL